MTKSSSRKASLETALSVIDEFKLKKEKARDLIGEVRKAVKGWRDSARFLGLYSGEIEGMSSAFAAR